MLDAELMAARLGDTQAADCFVTSAAMFATPGTHMGPNREYDAAIAKPFAEAALEIALQGIERGDWRMVRTSVCLLQRRRESILLRPRTTRPCTTLCVLSTSTARASRSGAAGA